MKIFCVVLTMFFAALLNNCHEINTINNEEDSSLNSDLRGEWAESFLWENSRLRISPLLLPDGEPISMRTSTIRFKNDGTFSVTILPPIKIVSINNGSVSTSWLSDTNYFGFYSIYGDTLILYSGERKSRFIFSQNDSLLNLYLIANNSISKDQSVIPSTFLWADLFAKYAGVFSKK